MSGFSTILNEPQSVNVHENYIELEIDLTNFAFSGTYQIKYNPNIERINGLNGNAIDQFERTFQSPKCGAGDTTTPKPHGAIIQ